ncbi:zinc finger protein 518B [Acipenser ruthenus]|uniref:zinc finger protein 518B n=1 Tax=Acipenser ruthenus TaxID=7906 RepID=UPI0027422408|nr:zinc finger protein 518B [Acipenser ruthenus]XP_058861577.1 zinc finger protein 518B [Acipenser ruthenus]XP_058861588.1 zinc finger protein 518B [Acipenser ruthenus]
MQLKKLRQILPRFHSASLNEEPNTMDRDSRSANNKLVNKTKTVNGQDCNEKIPDCDREMLTISIKCKQTEDVSSKYPEGIPMFLCSKCGFYSEDMEHTDMHPVCHEDNSLANMENQVDKKKPHYCEEHFEKQTKSEKYQCDKCRFFSRDITQFKKHVLQHDEIKFTCSYCNHISYTKGESQRHLVQHTGKFPYRCEFCDYGAVRNDYIVKHTQRVHCKRKECTDDSAVKNTDGSPVKRAILEAKSISQQESWTGNNTFSSPTDKTCIYNTEVNATAVVQGTTMGAAKNIVSPNTNKQICNSTGVCSSKVQVELLTPLNGPMQPGTALTTVAPSQFVVPPGCFAQVLEVKTENGTQQLVLKLIPQDASGVEVLENTTACSSEIYGKQQELSYHGLSPFDQSKTVVSSKIRNSISDEFETAQSHQENMCSSLSENAGSSGFINAADLVNREQLFLPPTKGSDVFQVAASPEPRNIHSAGTLRCPSKADLCVERNAPQKECIPLNAPLFKNGINEKPEEDCADESFETVNWPIISSVFSLCCETEDFLGGIRWDGNLESICDGRGTNDSVILASAEKHNKFDFDKTVIPEQKEKGDCSATVNIEVKATKIAGSAKSNAGSPNRPTISSYTESKPTEETPVTSAVPSKNASQSLHPMSDDISVHSPEASTTEFSKPQKLTPTELIPNNESEAAQIKQPLVAYSNSTESKIVDNISGNVPVLGNQANIFGGDINSLVIQKEENSSTENHTIKQHLTGLQSTSIAGYCDGSSKIGVQYENKAHEKLLPCAKNDTSKQLSIDTGLDVPQQLILSTSPDMVALNCGIDRSTINAEKVYNRRRKLRSFLESPPVFIPQGTVLKVLNSNEQLQSETAVINTRKVFENSELLLTPRPVPFSSLEIRNIVLPPENQETNMCAEHWSKKKITTTSMKRKRAQEDNENIEERLEVAKRLTLTLSCKNGPWHKARKHKKKKRKTDGTDPKCNTFYALKKATRLRLIPLRNDQLIKCPLHNQPVIVLNHPEVDTTEVTNIMHTINKYKGNVLKVALSERTKVSLHLKKQIMKQSEAQCQLTGPVEERQLLKMKIKKIQDNYQVVGIVPGLSHP